MVAPLSAWDARGRKRVVVKGYGSASSLRVPPALDARLPSLRPRPPFPYAASRRPTVCQSEMKRDSQMKHVRQSESLIIAIACAARGPRRRERGKARGALAPSQDYSSCAAAEAEWERRNETRQPTSSRGGEKQRAEWRTTRYGPATGAPAAAECRHFSRRPSLKRRRTHE